MAQATAETEVFADIMARAEARVEAGEAKSLFVALRTLGVEESIDYAQFFPEIEIRDIANRTKRNNVLLKY